MNPVGIIRRAGKLIRGGAGTPQIVLGAVLGALLGMNPHFNGSALLGILLLLILNANLGVAILGFLAGKILCLLLAPVTFEIGFAIIHRIGLEGLFRWIYDTPGLALLNLDNYCLVGGIPLAILLGLVGGGLLAGVITRFRRAMVSSLEKSDRTRRMGENPAVRFLAWVVFGKQKGTFKEMLEKRHPLLRRSGLIFVAVVVAAVVVFELVYLDRLAYRAIKQGLENANGAQVDIAEVEISLTGAKLRMAGVQVTDPQRPTHNLVQVDQLVSDLSIRDLLRRRLVIREAVVDRMDFDVQRESPGEVFRPAPPPQPQPPRSIEEYLRQAEKYLEYLRRLREYLEKRRQQQQREPQEEPTTRPEEDLPLPDPNLMPPPPQEDLREQADYYGYFALSAAELLTDHPRVTVRSLRVESLPVQQQRYTLIGRELSDQPELNERPMEISLENDAGRRAAMKIDFSYPGSQHKLDVAWPNQPLDPNWLTAQVPLEIESAVVDVEAHGAMNYQHMLVPVVLHLRELKASARQGEGLLGLDAQTTRQILEKIQKLDVAMVLYGAPDAPQVRIDETTTLASLKAEAQRAGLEAASRLVGEQLEKSGLSEKLPGDLKNLNPGDMLKGLGDRKPDANDSAGEATEEGGQTPEEEKSPGEALRGILGD
jgi:uncharacterized protein (TIGR03546 family)